MIPSPKHPYRSSYTKRKQAQAIGGLLTENRPRRCPAHGARRSCGGSRPPVRNSASSRGPRTPKPPPTRSAEQGESGDLPFFPVHDAEHADLAALRLGGGARDFSPPFSLFPRDGLELFRRGGKRSWHGRLYGLGIMRPTGIRLRLA
jgi:hypothetical protein